MAIRFPRPTLKVGFVLLLVFVRVHGVFHVISDTLFHLGAPWCLVGSLRVVVISPGLIYRSRASVVANASLYATSTSSRVIVLESFFPTFSRVVRHRAFLVRSVHDGGDLQRHRSLLGSLVVFLRRATFFFFVLSNPNRITSRYRLTSGGVSIQFNVRRDAWIPSDTFSIANRNASGKESCTFVGLTVRFVGSNNGLSTFLSGIVVLRVSPPPLWGRCRRVSSRRQCRRAGKPYRVSRRKQRISAVFIEGYLSRGIQDVTSVYVNTRGCDATKGHEGGLCEGHSRHYYSSIYGSRDSHYYRGCRVNQYVVRRTKRDSNHPRRLMQLNSARVQSCYFRGRRNQLRNSGGASRGCYGLLSHAPNGVIPRASPFVHYFGKRGYDYRSRSSLGSQQRTWDGLARGVGPLCVSNHVLRYERAKGRSTWSGARGSRRGRSSVVGAFSLGLNAQFTSVQFASL